MPRLPRRWNKLRHHPIQRALWTSPARFRVVPSGRRSGKTELAKRYLVKQALKCSRGDGWFVAAAPTHDQAKRIFWKDIKKLVPSDCVNRINESERTIELKTGTVIQVMGLDKPERVEGPPLDGIVLDEYANMKREVWDNHVRPSLSTPGREGWAWVIGVPEGRNHYWEMAVEAQNDTENEWGYFHWLSRDILTDKEIESAKRKMDPLTFEQEYEGSFVNFAGRAYHEFSAWVNVKQLAYDPDSELILCFDFNTAPGVCCIAQEFRNPGWSGISEIFTGIIDEVFIPRNSTTLSVCQEIARRYSEHRSYVRCYGDATGGAKKTVGIAGTDWDLIDSYLRPVFRSNLKFHVPRANPSVRSRINAMNSRCRSADDMRHLIVDPECKRTIRDLEGVVLKEGTMGELDKDGDNSLTHISDALGYYIVYEYPVRKREVFSQQF